MTTMRLYRKHHPNWAQPHASPMPVEGCLVSHTPPFFFLAAHATFMLFFFFFIFF
ncbi:hypothetical protein BC940DRAFT_259762, partial [Gongronella butleri]